MFQQTKEKINRITVEAEELALIRALENVLSAIGAGTKKHNRALSELRTMLFGEECRDSAEIERELQANRDVWRAF